MTWKIMTRIEGAIFEFSNPAPLRYANPATGEIRERESFSALVEDRDELADICGRVAEALGPAVLRRWEDRGPEAVDLAAAVREMRQMSERHECGCHDAESPSIALIAAERQRQVNEEGWTPEHDDQHDRDELTLAAARYALPARHRGVIAWPWERSSWRPTPRDRVRELVRAGALIAAEIDRLLRKAARSGDGLG